MKGTGFSGSKALGFALVLSLAPCVGAQPVTITHIRPESEADLRNVYFIEVLKLALAGTQGTYRLAAHPTVMQQGRALELLKKGEGLDVVWTMTSAERERDLLPIRIPLFKGLIGTRLLLINRDDQHRFLQITRSEQLKALLAGQGHDWPDARILKKNGYALTESAHYHSLFKMLRKHRIDYFPRSVLEIWEEADRHADAGLAVETSLVLYYPTALYFFVNKNNMVLARRLEQGLRKTLADGSFDRLFLDHFGDVIRRAQLGERTRFALENPLLPSVTPLDNPHLWYTY